MRCNAPWAPSLLPGWTRGHVVTHLTRNAEGLRNLLHWAESGAVRYMYESRERRDADIEASATRSAHDLRADSGPAMTLRAIDNAGAWQHGGGDGPTVEGRACDWPGGRSGAGAPAGGGCHRRTPAPHRSARCADIAPEALGLPLQAIVVVRLQSKARRRIAEFADYLCTLPGVLNVFFLAGADDFQVHVASESTDALRDLVVDNLSASPDVAMTETHLIFEHISLTHSLH